MSGTRITTQGLISPGTPFVDPGTGVLPPVSFRFLAGLFGAIQQLQLMQGAAGGGGGGSGGTGSGGGAATVNVSASQSGGSSPSVDLRMIGLALLFTPLAASVAIQMDLQVTQTSHGAPVRGGMAYGQGTLPAAGDPLPSGLGLIGGGFTYTVPLAGTYSSISQSGTITGLTAGQTYWADIALGAAGSGSGYGQSFNLTVRIGLPPA